MNATPIDPTLPEMARRLHAALSAGALPVPEPGLVASRLEVSLLGTGESYAAWLVSDGVTSWVFRVARRRVEDMPCPMEDELRAAAFVSDGIGSRAVAVEVTGDNALGCPYVVSTFVPGEVRAPAAWDRDLLRAHARGLAALHRPDFQLAGRIGEPGTAFDIVDEFDGGWAWWRSAHPEITENPSVIELAGAVRRRLLDLAPAFYGIGYSVIHGDLVATNVLVDDAGTPRYVDWEWARIGDVANDLALIGGTVTGGPWYVPMDDAMIDEFVSTYVETCRECGRPVDDVHGLRDRRDAWELTERFLTSLHFDTKATGDDMYAEATQSMRRGLWRLVSR